MLRKTLPINTPADRSERPRRKVGSYAYRRWIPYLFITPGLAVLFLFYILPAIVGLGVSFTRWDALRPPVFIGLGNFIALFQDPNFYHSILVTVEYAVLSLVTQLPLALFLAYLLSQQKRGSKVFQAVFFIPQILSLVAVGVLWSLLYDPFNGPPARILGLFGVGPIDWLGKYALLSLVLASAWVYFGFHMVLQLAGMTAIPSELYDSARLDTASSLQVFFRVTLPLLRETLLISTVLMVSGAFSYSIGITWVLTRGGPLHATELLPIFMYKAAFSNHQFGYSSAVSIVMVIFIAVLVGIIVWWFGRERIEY
ncbi:MAG: sugar ABC transporter permease [Chloroflexi bacterium]|nr:sugar ABC transporter permease [Chloroflexota bacterium]